jgi:hypothetical protein
VAGPGPSRRGLRVTGHVRTVTARRTLG